MSVGEKEKLRKEYEDTNAVELLNGKKELLIRLDGAEGRREGVQVALERYG